VLAAIEASSAGALEQWRRGQRLRYDVLSPLLLIVAGAIVPAVLFAAVARWQRANHDRVRPLWPALRSWWGVAAAWLMLLFLIGVVASALRFGDLSYSIRVPIGLAVVYLMLRGHVHPRVAPFDQRFGAGGSNRRGGASG
jgi:hypothetical protein